MFSLQHSGLVIYQAIRRCLSSIKQTIIPLNRSQGVPLLVANHGVIAGGGGSGATGWYDGGSGNYNSTGGGGCGGVVILSPVLDR